MGRILLLIGGLLAAGAIGMGAYAAHPLEGSLKKQNLDEETIVKRVDQCETGARYQMYAAIGVILCGVLAGRRTSIGMVVAAAFILLGALLFSGGLYLLVFTHDDFHPAIIPSGGVSFIIGWIIFAICGLFTGGAKPAK